MSRICSHCNFKNPTGMHFCGNCGTRLGGSTPNQDGLYKSQLRHVTVLFTDLSGYTAAASRLDSEVLYELVQQYTDLITRQIYLYEGVVDKLTGDGVMALFGAPVSYENNSERALRAALEMQATVSLWCQQTNQNLGTNLSMRIGIHSGQVIVGEIGSNLVMDYTAIGETVNIANRLEQAATPGTILVSEDVYHQTRSIFDYFALPQISLKGILYPVNTYEVLGAKIRIETLKGSEGLHAPLIGRAAETAVLLRAVEELTKQQKGTFILISGEAGIGKTRMLIEFKNTISSSCADLLQGNTLTYRRSVPYWLFIDMLRNFLGVNSNSNTDEISKRLKDVFGKTPQDEAFLIPPYIEQLLGISNPDSKLKESQPLESGAVKDQLAGFFYKVLLSGAKRKPTVWILEDLHWADEASLDLLESILSNLPKTPLLIIAATRLEQNQSLLDLLDWAKQNLGSSFLNVQIKPLSNPQSRRLLSSLVSSKEFPEHVSDQIIEHSGGVPLYVEEVLRMLIDSGVLQRDQDSWHATPGYTSTGLGVPVSLQGLIQARFDHLTTYQRQVLQSASTIGHHFDLGLLKAILPPTDSEMITKTLDILQQREFIIQTPGNPQGEYAFRHGMMSEAIYSTMLKKERSRLHTQTAMAIEALYSDRLQEFTELLARHYSWSDNNQKALHYLILTGNKAALAQLDEQARRHFEHALALLSGTEHTPLQALQVHLGLGDLMLRNGDTSQARSQYLAALDMISNTPDTELQESRNMLVGKLRTLVS